MKEADRDHGDYVRKVQEGTQRYTQGLLQENERLRARVAALETENQKLADEVATLRDLDERQQRRQVELEARLQRVEDENRRFSQEYSQVEQQNSNLANLYVANYRLHGTLDRAEVLLAIQEIIANLVGSEEMAVFERDAQRPVLTLVGSFGIDAERYREVALGSGIMGRSAAQGEPYLWVPGGAEEPKAAHEDDLTACVPLMLDGRVTGLIALFRLLSHKASFEAVDREIFDLLASQAAIALYCTRLHSLHGAA
jgi:GAF domain-containing protein